MLPLLAECCHCYWFLQHIFANVLIKKRINEDHSLLFFVPDAQPVINLALSNALLGEPPLKCREIIFMLRILRECHMQTRFPILQQVLIPELPQLHQVGPQAVDLLVHLHVSQSFTPQLLLQLFPAAVDLLHPGLQLIWTALDPRRRQEDHRSG